MSADVDVTFSGDLSVKLSQFDSLARRAITASAKYTASVAESYMKSNAPWTDRTGAARNGLGARVVEESSGATVVLYHSVPYGPYLEVRWGGKYAIIEPTIQHAAPIFAETVGKILFKGAA